MEHGNLRDYEVSYKQPCPWAMEPHGSAGMPLTGKGKKDGASGQYPMNDKKHARLAKSGASRAEHVGNISKATEKKIDAKADKMLKK